MPRSGWEGRRCVTRSTGASSWLIKVVDPELVEVAEHHETGAGPGRVDPVLERLPVVLRRSRPAFFISIRTRGFQTRSANAVPGFRAIDAHLQRRAGMRTPPWPRALKRCSRKSCASPFSSPVKCSWRYRTEALKALVQVIGLRVRWHRVLASRSRANRGGGPASAAILP